MNNVHAINILILIFQLLLIHVYNINIIITLTYKLCGKFDVYVKATTNFQLQTISFFSIHSFIRIFFVLL